MKRGCIQGRFDAEWLIAAQSPNVPAPVSRFSALQQASAWFTLFAMITTVTTKNIISIPAAVGRRLGIKPGYRLDWQIPPESADALSARVIPDRATLSARRKEQ
jgi:hypothetical protein